MSQAKLAVLLLPLQSNERASYSFVITIAEMLSNIKNLFPPCPETVPLLKKKSSQAKCSSKRQERSFEPWCDYLFTLVTEEKVVVVDDEAILFDQVEENFIKVIEETGYFEMTSYAFNQDPEIAFSEAKGLLTKGASNQA